MAESGRDLGSGEIDLTGDGQVGRMLMTLARTTTRTATEISDCIAMSALARTVSGMVSVGLKATTLVNAT